MSNLKSQEILLKSLNITRKCFFIRENNQALASIGQPAVLHQGTCECCTGIIPEFRVETLNPGINPRFPVYLALIPGYREETLKPEIIPGNPVYLAEVCTGLTFLP